MKAEKITGYICSECNTIYEDEDEADNCCPKDSSDEVDAWKCGECEEIYEDKEEAKECCK